MIQASRIFSIVLLAAALGPTGSPHLSAQSSPQQLSWANLISLAPGAEIKVIASHGRSQRGTFQSVTDDAITVHFATGDQIFKRQDVGRVLVKREGHRSKHALIGIAIGIGAGLALGAAADHSNNRHQFINLWPNAGKAVGITIGALVGTGIGALLPASGWKTIYEVR